ncbi:MAG: MaoC family dehydratase [Pseudomonadota bacterium]
MYFDDLSVGQSWEQGPTVLEEADIIAFASQWDPQLFHLDHEAAAKSLFGGLVASGFHTMLTAFRQCVELPIFVNASMGSPGFEDLAWLRPVRPGDALTTKLEVMSLRASGSRPDRGYAGMAYETRNQQGEPVMRFRSTVIFACRPASA